jgi:hypothetical protein
MKRHRWRRREGEPALRGERDKETGAGKSRQCRSGMYRSAGAKRVGPPDWNRRSSGIAHER